MKLFIQTFGCQMNVADSEEMLRHLRPHGMTLTDASGQADVVLLNTCTVRQHAEDKALSFLGRMKAWKKKDPKRLLIVAGCAAERLQSSLKKRFPHVDLVIGAKSIDQFAELIKSHLKTAAGTAKAFDWFGESQAGFDGSELRPEGKPLILGAEGETAFVTIMRGCNYSCSYCIVPAVRGREIYRPPESVLDEARAKASAGAARVMLLGQTVNSYWHRDAAGKMTDFADLVRAVDVLEDVREIRFMSPHPHYMSPRLIEALASCRKVSPEIHLPVQSGSDAVLSAMKRNYTREEFVSIAGALRRAIPDLRLSTDFIVGFPGETEADFAQTLSLAEQVPFSLAYCFKYSPRQGTESARLPDSVSTGEKERRLARLLEKMDAPVPTP